MRIRRKKRDLRTKRIHPDENPMEVLANLLDVMLVFACGLMIALIINWKVDIGMAKVDYEVGKEMTELEMPQDQSETNIDNSQEYEKMGVLYKDPQTGKMYMITE